MNFLIICFFFCHDNMLKFNMDDAIIQFLFSSFFVVGIFGCISLYQHQNIDKKMLNVECNFYKNTENIFWSVLTITKVKDLQSREPDFRAYFWAIIVILCACSHTHVFVYFLFNFENNLVKKKIE